MKLEALDSLITADPLGWRFLRVFDPVVAAFGEIHKMPEGDVDLWMPPPLGLHNGWTPIGEVAETVEERKCPDCNDGRTSETTWCFTCKGQGSWLEKRAAASVSLYSRPVVRLIERLSTTERENKATEFPEHHYRARERQRLVLRVQEGIEL